MAYEEVLRQRRNRFRGGSAPAVRNPGSRQGGDRPGRRPIPGKSTAPSGPSKTQPTAAEQAGIGKMPPGRTTEESSNGTTTAAAEKSPPKRMKTRGAIPEAAPAPPAGRGRFGAGVVRDKETKDGGVAQSPGSGRILPTSFERRFFPVSSLPPHGERGL